MASTTIATTVGAPGKATSKNASAVPGEAPASSAQPASGERAQSVMERLNGLMLTAAKISTQAISGDDLGDAIRAANIPVEDCAGLQDVFVAARDKMQDLAQYTGQDIVSGLVKSGGRFKFDESSGVAMALKEAIETQDALAQAIRKLMDDHPKMSDAAYDRLMNLSLQCDRRMAEINRLALQVANAAADAAAAGNSSADALLDSEFTELMAQQELEMHGNADRLETLKGKLDPLLERMTSLAAKPNASLGLGEYLGCMLDLATVRRELSKVAAKNIEYAPPKPSEPEAPPRLPTVSRMKEAASAPPAPPATPALHVLPDTELLTAAVEVLADVKDAFVNTRQRIGGEMLSDFVDRTFSLGARFPHLAKENLPLLGSLTPTIARAVELREALREAAMGFMKSPSRTTLEALWDCSDACQQLVSDETVIDTIRMEMMDLQSNSGPGEALPPCDDWDAIESGICKVRGLDTQVAHFLQMFETVRDDLAPHKFLTTTSALALMEGRLEFPALVEARVHGMSDADVDPACDDSRARKSDSLGSGLANTVQLITYKDDSERVFKAESAGRQGMVEALLSRDYRLEQKMVQLNLATQDAAKALDLGDVVVKCSVGVHDGDFGLFMEKGTGLEAKKFATATSAKGGLTAAQVKALAPEKHARAVGGLLRSLNRLEWLDLVTGQGDRHAGNYMIDVRDGEDVSVTVKGIDNDECFPAFRTGLYTFVLDDVCTDEFYRVLREEVLPYYPIPLQQKAVARFESDPGIVDNGDNTITINTAEFESGELYMAATFATGAHGLTRPKYIDEDLYLRLMALMEKDGAVRKDYLASLGRRLPEKAAVDAAERRLDEAIKLAEDLKGAGMVFSAKTFADPDVQRRIIERELAAPDPIPAEKGFSLPSDSRIRGFAQAQTISIFTRDILPFVAKDGQFAQAVA